MKEFCARNIPKNTIYKDVVIIGNGPSGISLSYMLSGNWPYWDSKKIEKHPDEFLKARLNYADSSRSLVEQDLLVLADGLEGRSTNPISLLLDSLEHPGADLGMELPSMLEYRNHPNVQIDHIVLGKGPTGGSWHRMDPNLRTLSLAAWMSLPGLSYSDWESCQLLKKGQNDKNKEQNNRNTEQNDINKEQNDINKMNLRKDVLKKASPSSTPPPSSSLLSPATITCNKCIELRKKKQKSREKILNTNNKMKNSEKISILENNNESETGALCCKCTKALTMGTNYNIANSNSTITTTTTSTITSNPNNQSIINSNSDNDDNGLLLTSQSVNIPPRRNLSLKRQVSKEVQTRALVSRVAKYYEDYVKLMNLDKYFINDIVITLIAPLQEDCSGQGKFRLARWIVMGINRTNGRAVYYACRNVVLANGASDLANRLGLRGENLNTHWVKHELPELESALESLTDVERKDLKPVLIIGAGLSAADAVTICRSSDIHVIHIFRSRTAGLDKMLPENVYPEYHEVHRMMKDSNKVHEFYTPVPEHTISDLTTDSNGIHKVTVQNLINGETKTFEVSYCAILIGSRPDLRFISSLTKSSALKTSSTDLLNDRTNLDYSIITPSTTQQQQQQQQQNKKLSWLKALCAKCKQFNLCDWGSSRGEYRKICNHSTIKPFESDKFSQLEKDSPAIVPSSICCSIDESGLGLGIDPTKPVDCKSNQIDVNKYTNEVIHAPKKGLYAMGPLVGDNFVRFIPGGALAITAALHREND